MILRAKNGFGAKKVKFSEKMRNGGKWSPKHLKKDRFRKVLSDRAGNGIPGTKKVDFFEKIALFRPKTQISEMLRTFRKKCSKSVFGAGRFCAPLKTKPK